MILDQQVILMLTKGYHMYIVLFLQIIDGQKIKTHICKIIHYSNNTIEYNNLSKHNILKK